MRSMFRTLRLILWVGRLVFRFVAGRPMSGERKTDATFWRPARHSLDPSGTALRWEMMRGASRAAWRMGGLYLLLLTLLMYPLHLLGKVISLPWYLTPSFLITSHLSVIGGSAGVYLLQRMMRERGFYLPTIAEKEEGGRKLALQRVEGVREWRKEKVLPVAKSVSVILQQHIPERKAHEWVVIPKNYREPKGKAVEIRLPSSFTGADEGVKKRLVSSVSHKLGVSGMLPSWQLGGSSPRLLLSSPPTPPDRVEYAEVEKFLLASEEYRPLLGVTGEGEPLVAEMIDDSPHVALSAGPGAGKSTMAKLIAMQALRWGWGIVVLDWKQTEAYSWMGGLPGVTYLTKVEQIHDMGVRLAEEVDLRKENGMAGRAKVLVIRDEWNVTAMLLQSYWTAWRASLEPEERRTTPVKSPALEGYAVLDFAGREYGLFDLCIAQRFSAKVFNGNADIRECFQIKLLARYSPQTQKMLAPDIKPFPKKSNHQGRWVVCVGDEATVVQGPIITNEEARKYALGGRANPTSPLTSTFTDDPGATSPEVDSTLEDQLPLGQPGAASTSSQVNLPVVALKLSEMVDRLEHLGITLSILQKAAGDTTSGFPVAIQGSPNRGYKYDLKAVREWAAARHTYMATKGTK